MITPQKPDATGGKYVVDASLVVIDPYTYGRPLPNLDGTKVIDAPCVASCTVTQCPCLIETVERLIRSANKKHAGCAWLKMSDLTYRRVDNPVCNNEVFATARRKWINGSPYYFVESATLTRKINPNLPDTGSNRIGEIVGYDEIAAVRTMQGKVISD